MNPTQDVNALKYRENANIIRYTVTWQQKLRFFLQERREEVSYKYSSLEEQFE